jgi:hypothetical protein
MAVAALTPISLSALQGNVELVHIEFDKVTQNDWIEFDRPVGFFWVQEEAGTTEVALFAACAVNMAGHVDASETAITYNGATAAQLPTSGDNMYIKIDTEIMKVTSYSSTVFTVVRGALGTTATTHQHTDPIFCLNSIVLPSAVVGKAFGMVAYLNE